MTQARDIKSLKADELNANKGTERGRLMVRTSLEQNGAGRSILLDREGNIVAGNKTWKGAIEAGIEQVIVVPTDGSQLVAVQRTDLELDSPEGRAIAISDNRAGEVGLDWDSDILNQLSESVDLETWWNPDELQDLIDDYEKGNYQGKNDGDEMPDIPVEAETKPGDLWLLGEHRLLCGDSTKIEDACTVMDGRLADLCFTDPPYGVAYVGKTKEALTIENDELSGDDLDRLIRLAFDSVDHVLRPGGYVLATVPAGPLHLQFAGDWLRREWLRQIMVWNKDSMVLGHSEYHYKHEPILFGWKPGDRLKNTDRTKTTVWDFDRPKASREHPTMKPIALWEYGIRNHTNIGDIIFEPFGGSGTTFLAAQKSGRVCCGIEIDPIYCDVIKTRWEEFTGEEAILDASAN